MSTGASQGCLSSEDRLALVVLYRDSLSHIIDSINAIEANFHIVSNHGRPLFAFGDLAIAWKRLEELSRLRTIFASYLYHLIDKRCTVLLPNRGIPDDASDYSHACHYWHCFEPWCCLGILKGESIILICFLSIGLQGLLLGTLYPPPTPHPPILTLASRGKQDSRRPHEQQATRGVSTSATGSMRFQPLP